MLYVVFFPRKLKKGVIWSLLDSFPHPVGNVTHMIEISAIFHSLSEIHFIGQFYPK